MNKKRLSYLTCVFIGALVVGLLLPPGSSDAGETCFCIDDGQREVSGGGPVEGCSSGLAELEQELLQEATADCLSTVVNSDGVCNFEFDGLCNITVFGVNAAGSATYGCHKCITGPFVPPGP
jgi:hypothetical protein